MIGLLRHPPAAGSRWRRPIKQMKKRDKTQAKIGLSMKKLGIGRIPPALVWSLPCHCRISRRVPLR